MCCLCLAIQWMEKSRHNKHRVSFIFFSVLRLWFNKSFTLHAMICIPFIFFSLKSPFYWQQHEHAKKIKLQRFPFIQVFFLALKYTKHFKVSLKKEYRICVISPFLFIFDIIFFKDKNFKVSYFGNRRNISLNGRWAFHCFCYVEFHDLMFKICYICTFNSESSVYRNRIWLLCEWEQ